MSAKRKRALTAKRDDKIRKKGINNKNRKKVPLRRKTEGSTWNLIESKDR